MCAGISLKMIFEKNIFPVLEQDVFRLLYYPTFIPWVYLIFFAPYVIFVYLTGDFGSLAELRDFFVMEPAVFFLIARIINVLFSTAAVFLIYLIAKKIFSKRAGLMAALLYGVSTKAFKQAVRRNKARFPEDFMFQLNTGEFNIWRSQFVTSKSDRMGLRHRPFVFTEQGVAMLSSILKSKRAIQVNIQIMRTFSKLREMLVENDDLRRKIEAIERHYDEQFKVVFDAIRSLFDQKAVDPQTIGFHEK